VYIFVLFFVGWGGGILWSVGQVFSFSTKQNRATAQYEGEANGRQENLRGGLGGKKPM